MNTSRLWPGAAITHCVQTGRFAQLTERPQGGVTKSFVEVEYAGKDRLFVPVEQLDRLRRYSYDGTPPTLNTLGREQWKKTKEIAGELHLSVKTVEYYREQIKRKLSLKDAAELTQYATAWVQREIPA